MNIETVRGAALPASVPMGKLNIWPTSDFAGAVRVARVRINRNGCDRDGHYWGTKHSPARGTLWNVYSTCGALDVTTWATSREAALRSVSARTCFVRRGQ